MNKYDVLVIGAGPCGISTAINLKKAGKKVAVIEGSTPGGKINIAPRVDNYPGEHEIPGPDLAYKFFERLNNEDLEMIPEFVKSISKEGDNFVLSLDSQDLEAKAVMIATGTQERKMGFANEDKLFGHGLSYCALCDGHFFKGQDIAVIGGGNVALKEAIHLAGLAHHLYVIHRRNEFRGSLKNVEELKSFPNVTILTPYVPVEFLGEEKVTGLKIQNVETKEEKILDIQGLFPLIGQIPNTQFVENLGILDEYKTIPVDKNMMSRLPGIFAGGDVLPRIIRQIYLAEHDGMVAAKGILAYLESK